MSANEPSEWVSPPIPDELFHPGFPSSPVADPEGDRPNPLPRTSILSVPFGLTETKLFHFHGILRKI